MKNTTNDLPPQTQAFASLLNAQHPELDDPTLRYGDSGASITRRSTFELAGLSEEREGSWGVD